MKKIKFFALWALLLTPPLLLSGCGDDATDDPFRQHVEDP